MMIPKVSQKELGKALGVTFQQIQKYEVGANRISTATLVRLAAALKVDVQYFFDELPANLEEQGNQNTSPRRNVSCHPWPSPDQGIS